MKKDLTKSPDNDTNQINLIESNKETVVKSRVTVTATTNNNFINFNGLSSAGEIHLGSGVDIKTGKIKETDMHENKMLLDGRIGYRRTVQSYQDFSDYHSGKSDNEAGSKSRYEGGASISYGLAQASAKYAKESESANANSAGEIIRTFGIVSKTSYYLPFDPAFGDYNEPSREMTEKLLRLGSGQITKYLDKIKYASSDYEKTKAIDDFYIQFGTHFISSVAKGYIGYLNQILTFKSNSALKKSSNAGSVSVGYSGLAKASAGYSDTDNSVFSMTDYDYKATKHAFPDNDIIKQALENLVTQVDEAMERAKDKFDFNSIKAKSDNLKFPNPADSIAISVEDKEASITRENLQKEMDKCINNLKINVDSYKSILNVESDEAKTKKLDLNKTINEELNKFSNRGIYADIVLSPSQKEIINEATVFTKDNSLTGSQIELELKKLEDKTTKEKAEIERAKNKKTFSAWLKDYYNNKKDNGESFSDWYAKQTPEKISELHKSWEEEISIDDKHSVKTSNISSEIEKDTSNKVTSFKPIQSKIISTSNIQSNSDDSAINPFVDLATLDYSITPWRLIFPELTFVNPDDSQDIFLTKIYMQINGYIEDYNYLTLVKTNLKSSRNLSEIHTSDFEIHKSLEKLYSKIMNFNATKIMSNVDSTISFSNSNFNLDKISDLNKLSTSVKNVIDKSALMKSEWYKVVQKLKSLGLISPNGVMLACQEPNEISNWSLLYGGFEFIQSMGSFYSGLFLKCKFSYSDKEFGSQIYNYLKREPGKSYSRTVCSILPLVGFNSKIEEVDKDKNGKNGKQIVTNIYFINELSNDPSTNSPLIDNTISPQIISLKNKNTNGTPVFEVCNQLGKDFGYSKVSNKDKNLKYESYVFNNVELEKDKKITNLYKVEPIHFSLVPITKNIMKEFDPHSSEFIGEDSRYMNVFYSSGNSNTKSMINSIFGDDLH